MTKKLVIIGAGSVGGHIAYNLAEYGLQNYDVLGFLDDDPDKINKKVFDYPVLGSIESIINIDSSVSVILGIAFPKSKIQIMKRLDKIGKFDFPKLIAKSAWISSQVEISEGAIIYPGCSINYGSKIDAFSVLNMNCAIGHDCIVGAFSSLAPGVSLAGHTLLGKGVEMGIASATVQDVQIGEDSIIGGQCLVTKSLPPNVTAVGIPGRIIKTHR